MILVLQVMVEYLKPKWTLDVTVTAQNDAPHLPSGRAHH